MHSTSSGSFRSAAAVASRSRAILPALLLSRPRNRRRVPRWFGGERLTYSPPKRTAAQTYEPRVFEGRVMLPDEIERIHQEILEFEMIETVSDPMRQLIEDLWPELVHKLPSKT